MNKAPTVILAAALMAATAAATLYFTIGEVPPTLARSTPPPSGMPAPGSPTSDPVSLSPLKAPVPLTSSSQEPLPLFSISNEPRTHPPAFPRQSAGDQDALNPQGAEAPRTWVAESKARQGARRTARLGSTFSPGAPSSNLADAADSLTRRNSIPRFARPATHSQEPSESSPADQQISAIAIQSPQPDKPAEGTEQAVTSIPSPAPTIGPHPSAIAPTPAPVAAGRPARRAWPKPYTPEQERYRQQVGVQTFIELEYEQATGQPRK